MMASAPEGGGPPLSRWSLQLARRSGGGRGIMGVDWPHVRTSPHARKRAILLPPRRPQRPRSTSITLRLDARRLPSSSVSSPSLRSHAPPRPLRPSRSERPRSGVRRSPPSPRSCWSPRRDASRRLPRAHAWRAWMRATRAHGCASASARAAPPRTRSTMPRTQRRWGGRSDPSLALRRGRPPYAPWQGSRRPQRGPQTRPSPLTPSSRWRPSSCAARTRSACSRSKSGGASCKSTSCTGSRCLAWPRSTASTSPHGPREGPWSCACGASSDDARRTALAPSSTLRTSWRSGTSRGRASSSRSSWRALGRPRTWAPPSPRRARWRASGGRRRAGSSSSPSA